MDVKTRTKAATRGRRPRGSVLYRNTIPLNETTIRGGWTGAALISSTSGTISATYSPSIQNSAEYSTISSLFTEVKLIAFKMTLTPLVPYDTVITQSRMWVGYNMSFTDATHTNPTSMAQVTNLTNSRVINSQKATPTVFTAPVPRRLDHSLMAQDSPTLATPYAGSPGMFVMWGDGFSASVIGFWRVDLTAIWHCRGRN
jgi:hypothetical protein